MKQENPTGFSLIESLLLIAIIASLAAFLPPTLSTAKRKARPMACENFLKQLHQGHRAGEPSGQDPAVLRSAACLFQ